MSIQQVSSLPPGFFKYNGFRLSVPETQLDSIFLNTSFHHRSPMRATDIMEDLPLLTSTSLVFITIAYILITLTIHKFSPVPDSDIALYIHNRIQILLAISLFILTISSTISPTAPINIPLLSSSPIPIDTLGRLSFHYSKFYEYFDTFIYTAQGKGSDIGAHWAFHHLTTPWYTFVRVIPPGTANRGWQVFAAMNTFHHAFMHAYFVGANGDWNKMLLGWTRNVQLVGGIGYDLWLVYAKAQGSEIERAELWRNWVGIGILSCYLVLHRREVVLMAKGETRRQMKKVTRAKVD
jgi:hypothetical protein